MKRLALVGLLALAACNDTPVNTRADFVTPADQALMQSAIVDRMKDPASAQLRNVRAFDASNGAGRIICGEANGRNSFGGYAGFEPFYLRVKDGRIVAMQTGMTAYPEAGRDVRRACADAAAGRLMVQGAV